MDKVLMSTHNTPVCKRLALWPQELQRRLGMWSIYGSINITVEREYEFRWTNVIYIIASSCFTGLLGWGKETEEKQGTILNTRGNNIL